VLNAAKKAQADLTAEEARAGESEAIIKKEFELFKYRDMCLCCTEVDRDIAECQEQPGADGALPSFWSGDAKTMKEKFPNRRERKQIFVTGMSIYYTLDVENGQFGTLGFERVLIPGRHSERQVRRQMASRDMMRGGAEAHEAGAGQIFAWTRGKMGGAPGGAVGAASNRGFVITISGYSPYNTILLDPVKVQDDPNKWGLVTRLVHLDSMFDGNSPFELYKKTDKQHFDLRPEKWI